MKDIVSRGNKRRTYNSTNTSSSASYISFMAPPAQTGSAFALQRHRHIILACSHVPFFLRVQMLKTISRRAMRATFSHAHVDISIFTPTYHVHHSRGICWACTAPRQAFRVACGGCQRECREVELPPRHCNNARYICPRLTRHYFPIAYVIDAMSLSNTSTRVTNVAVTRR